MKCIGVIVTNKKIRNVPSYICVYDEDVDTEYPKLYIGEDIAKKYNKTINVLDRKIDEKTFWTYWKMVKKSEFENDLKNFYDFCVNRLIDTVKYTYVNILTLPKDRIKNLIKFLSSEQRKYIYISGGAFYVYYKKSIFGISLKLIDFCGFSSKKVVRFLIRNKNNKIKFDDKFLPKEIKPSFKNKKYAIAYFISLEDD